MFYNKKIYIPTEYCDYTVRLGDCQTFFLLQNAMIDGFEVYDCGNRGLGNKSNAYWAVTKTKLEILRKPAWGEVINVKSVYLNDRKLRVNIKTEIFDDKGELIIRGCQELCVLDKDTHRIKRLAETCLPQCQSNKNTETFDKFSIPQEESASYELTVRSQHIDMSRHVNNVEYIRMALDLFTVDELCSKETVYMEVHYIGECREKDKLLCQRFDQGEESFITISKENKKCFEMKIIRR